MYSIGCGSFLQQITTKVNEYITSLPRSLLADEQCYRIYDFKTLTSHPHDTGTWLRFSSTIWPNTN